MRGQPTNAFGFGVLRKNGTIEVLSVIVNITWRSAVILNEVTRSVLCKDLILPPSRFFTDAQNDKTDVEVKNLLTL